MMRGFLTFLNICSGIALMMLHRELSESRSVLKRCWCSLLNLTLRISLLLLLYLVVLQGVQILWITTTATLHWFHLDCLVVETGIGILLIWNYFTVLNFAFLFVLSWVIDKAIFICGLSLLLLLTCVISIIWLISLWLLVIVDLLLNILPYNLIVLTRDSLATQASLLWLLWLLGLLNPLIKTAFSLWRTLITKFLNTLQFLSDSPKRSVEDLLDLWSLRCFDILVWRMPLVNYITPVLVEFMRPVSCVRHRLAVAILRVLVKRGRRCYLYLVVLEESVILLVIAKAWVLPLEHHWLAANNSGLFKVRWAVIIIETDDTSTERLFMWFRSEFLASLVVGVFPIDHILLFMVVLKLALHHAVYHLK